MSKSLSVIGSDIGFGQGYEISAVRFVSRRLYLVLFKQGLSPYAVVTLANYYSPQFLGIFSLSGFSSYLHPYDENTLIAIGKEVTQNQLGGLKIALFDVTNPASPYKLVENSIQ